MKIRGRVVLPLDSQLWDLSPATLGLLMHLHRAIILHGDREMGLLSADLADVLAEKINAMDELIELESAGIISDAEPHSEGLIRVRTWAAAQGNKDSARRKQARHRISKHRDENGCNALHMANPMKSQGEPCISSEAVLETLQPLEPKVLLENNTTTKRSGSGSDSIRSSLKTPNVRSKGKRDRPTSGFVGTADQGLLMVNSLVSPMVLKIASAWVELEPFKHLCESREFIEKLVKTYPDVNVLEESLKVDAWWYANPAKRKSKRGTPKFINAWMSNAQERAALNKRREKAKKRMGDPHASTVASVWGRKKK